MRLSIALLVLLAVSGCEIFGDCSFDTTEVASFDTVSASGDVLGDTLTVVFVQTLERRLNVFVQADLRPSETTEAVNGVGTVSVTYDAEGLELGRQPSTRAPRFAGTLRDDTLYVYTEGAFDAFTEACSPPEAYLRMDVLSVRAPARVRAVRVQSVDLYELEAEVQTTLRRLDAERVRPSIVA